MTELIPLPQLREAISLIMLRANIERWVSAPIKPHPTQATKHDTLDILLPDGSIVWARTRDATFTEAFARDRALAFAAQRRNDPPTIDPQGVAEIERLLAFLRDRDVEVYLAHPPFKPDLLRRAARLGLYGGPGRSRGADREPGRAFWAAGRRQLQSARRRVSCRECTSTRSTRIPTVFNWS